MSSSRGRGGRGAASRFLRQLDRTDVPLRSSHPRSSSSPQESPRSSAGSLGESMNRIDLSSTGRGGTDPRTEIILVSGNLLPVEGKPSCVSAAITKSLKTYVDPGGYAWKFVSEEFKMTYWNEFLPHSARPYPQHPGWSVLFSSVRMRGAMEGTAAGEGAAFPRSMKLEGFGCSTSILSSTCSDFSSSLRVEFISAYSKKFEEIILSFPAICGTTEEISMVAGACSASSYFTTSAIWTDGRGRSIPQMNVS